MKYAISYQRISDKDQSRWSIAGQDESHKVYAEKNDITIIATFIDKGQSAKNFDRANWHKLEKFVQDNHRQVDFLLVYDWSRFSRNTKEALQMIELLEGRYRIRVISVTQPIGLHPESPYYHHLRTQMIQNGELELRIIRDRTRFGLQQAAKQGRYVTTAPFGYLNTRDAADRPLIVIDETRAAIVREIFDRFINGETISSIRKAAAAKGCTLTGNSSYQHLLSNPVYMGYVKKPAYYDDPEKLVKGIHTPIIEEMTWYKANAILTGRNQLQRSLINQDVPLKGVLKCYCGRCLTAGNSRGRKKYYWYYKCNTHSQHNLPAGRLHSQFDEILKTLSFPSFHLDYLQGKITALLSQRLKDRNTGLQAAESNQTALQLKIDQVEEKYITGGIDAATYQKWKGRYISEMALLQKEIAALRLPLEKVWQDCRDNLQRLTDIHFLYHLGSLETKQEFTRLVFDNQLYYQDSIYRTTFLLSPFTPKAMELKEKGLLIYQQPNADTGQISESAPDRNIIEPLERLLHWAGSLKVA